IHPSYTATPTKLSSIFEARCSHHAAIAVLRRLYDTPHFTLTRKRERALELIRGWDAIEHLLRNPAECTVSGCSRKPIARALCTLHYQRWKNNGDPTVSRN